jgi:hypothetical protein
MSATPPMFSATPAIAAFEIGNDNNASSVALSENPRGIDRAPS